MRILETVPQKKRAVRCTAQNSGELVVHLSAPLIIGQQHTEILEAVLCW